MKIKIASIFSLVFALALVFCMATDFATSATNQNSQPENGNADSDFPTGSAAVMSNYQNNREAGPLNEDSSAEELFSVNRGDESKFTPAEWEEILQKVENGEILLFDTLEDELTYNQTQNIIK